MASDGALGDAAGSLTFNGGALETTASFDMMRQVNLVGTGTFRPDGGTLLALSGPVTGGGSLIMDGQGELVLAAPATYTGDTFVNRGTLSAGAANAFSAASAHTVTAGATLNLNGFDQTIL